jgi:hypothetical protein
MTTLLGNKV